MVFFLRGQLFRAGLAVLFLNGPVLVCICRRGEVLNVLLFNALVLQVTLNVFELASAAGFTCDVDPALVSAIVSMRTGTL